MTISPQDLSRQAMAVQQLLAAYRDIIAGDEDFASDVIEGQTDFVEIVNAMVAQEGQDAAHVAAIQDYIDALSKRALRINARIEKRRLALISAFQTAEIKGSLRCPLATVGLRNTPRKVVPVDEKLIPDEFWKPREPTLDKAALGAALKSGRQIPGAELSNGGVTISIRTA
jgi:hypothetical protein